MNTAGALMFDRDVGRIGNTDEWLVTFNGAVAVMPIKINAKSETEAVIKAARIKPEPIDMKVVADFATEHDMWRPHGLR